MVEAARFSADGRLVLTVTDLGADGRREVRLSDAVRGTPAGPGASARDAGAAGSAAVRRDDAQLAVGTSAGALQTHDVRSGRRREATQGTLDITSVAYDPSGSRILTVGQDLTARVWNAGRLSAPAVVLRGHTGRQLGAEFSPDGRFVLTASTDGTARLWDSTLGTLVQVFDKSPNGGAGFSPDGRLVAIGGRATVEVHRCELCASLDGLVRIARARLPAG
jgi:WD40 repeat protein